MATKTVTFGGTQEGESDELEEAESSEEGEDSEVSEASDDSEEEISIYGLQKIDYSTVRRREKSFEDWNFVDKPTPKELAKAGFYYTGVSDKVVCFKCQGGVYEWEKDDIPMEEHKKYYPDCEFVLNPDKYIH